MTDAGGLKEVRLPVTNPRRRSLCGWIALLAALALIVGIPAITAYLGNKKMEQNYQDTMSEVQEVVTDYLLNNYAGVTKVEWQGVGVESLASDIIELSSSLNYIDSEARVYVNDTDYFMIEFVLHDEADYDPHEKQFVLNGTLTPKNMDHVFASGAFRMLDSDAEKARKYASFVKSSVGSPDAEVTYNVNIFKFDWA